MTETHQARDRVLRQARWWLVVLTALLMPPSVHAGEIATVTTGRRVALVVGNGGYATEPLKNPTNDARAMAAALAGLGFEVTTKFDADKETLLRAIRLFVSAANSSDVRVFYYAGHAVQIKGLNYLVPIDALANSDGSIEQRAIDTSELFERLTKIKRGINVVVLDACRTNPFRLLPNGRPKVRGPAASGLAELAAPIGTVIAYATSPGLPSIDTSDTPHSVYTKHLLTNIAVPGLSLENLFKRVRVAVALETAQQQVPWVTSSLIGDFCFRPGPNGACPAT